MKSFARVYPLYLLLCLGLLRLASSSEDLESCKAIKEVNKECESYAYSIVKPLLGYFDQVQRYNANTAEVKAMRNRIEELQSSLALYKGTIEKLSNHLGSENPYYRSLENERVTNCEQWRMKCETDPPSSCVPFGDAPGIYRIAFPNLYAFDVLCENVTSGSGWIVIQQRVDGREDFYRDWAAYSAGFGSFEGDFFMGLEKLHRLTNYRRHELYITMEKFDGSIEYARYNRFTIAGEHDQYRLLSLGEFSGSKGTEDHLRYHENQKFSTMDRDNDNWLWNNCAKGQHGGWWYDSCSRCNLNGKFFNHAKKNDESISWGLKTPSLKKVKMLIRPKAD